MFSGITVIIMILAGFVGSAVSGGIVARTGAFLTVIRVFFVCAALSAICQCEVRSILLRHVTVPLKDFELYRIVNTCVKKSGQIQQH